MKTHKSPNEFISRTLGTQIVAVLNSGSTIKGKLVCLDGFMNLGMVLDGAGQKTYPSFIRGSNVLFIRALSGK